MNLPAPITLKAAAPSLSTNAINKQGQGAQASPSQTGDLPNNPTPKSGQAADAVLPAADLKLLYDFAMDCKACQAKRAASQGDLTDEKTKTAALTKERDAAIKAAKGGSALRRIARAAKWFALGAAAGAIAAKSHTLRTHISAQGGTQHKDFALSKTSAIARHRILLTLAL